MVGIVWTNSFCFSLNNILVFPAPSNPRVITLISIFGPMCTRLSFKVNKNESIKIIMTKRDPQLNDTLISLLTLVNVIGIEPSAKSWSPCNAANCCLCVFAVFNISLISAAAIKTLASSCLETCSQFTQTVATYLENNQNK